MINNIGGDAVAKLNAMLHDIPRNYVVLVLHNDIVILPSRHEFLLHLQAINAGAYT